MRPVLKGEVPLDQGKEILFSDYTHARRYLIDRIGEYCSYCERKIAANLAVEHVQPKSLRPDLELVWDNFLLACTNCNSTKGNKPVILSDYFWPDKDNTFLFYDYDETGMVDIPVHITDVTIRSKIQAMLDLVGLQVLPPIQGTNNWQKASDRRTQHRIEAWYSASEYKDLYEKADSALKEQLIMPFITIVKNSGLWSIWMKIFQSHPEVIAALVSGLPGTNPIVLDLT